MAVPLVLTHPDTKRKSLYGTSHFCQNHVMRRHKQGYSML